MTRFYALYPDDIVNCAVVIRQKYNDYMRQALFFGGIEPDILVGNYVPMPPGKRRCIHEDDALSYAHHLLSFMQQQLFYTKMSNCDRYVIVDGAVIGITATEENLFRVSSFSRYGYQMKHMDKKSLSELESLATESNLTYIQAVSIINETKKLQHTLMEEYWKKIVNNMEIVS